MLQAFVSRAKVLRKGLWGREWNESKGSLTSFLGYLWARGRETTENEVATPLLCCDKGLSLELSTAIRFQVDN